MQLLDIQSDSGAIRTRDPQLRRLLLYPAEQGLIFAENQIVTDVVLLIFTVPLTRLLTHFK